MADEDKVMNFLVMFEAEFDQILVALKQHLKTKHVVTYDAQDLMMIVGQFLFEREARTGDRCFELSAEDIAHCVKITPPTQTFARAWQEENQNFRRNTLLFLLFSLNLDRIQSLARKVIAGFKNLQSMPTPAELMSAILAKWVKGDATFESIAKYADGFIVQSLKNQCLDLYKKQQAQPDHVAAEYLENLEEANQFLSDQFSQDQDAFDFILDKESPGAFNQFCQTILKDIALKPLFIETYFKNRIPFLELIQKGEAGHWEDNLFEFLNRELSFFSKMAIGNLDLKTKQNKFMLLERKPNHEQAILINNLLAEATYHTYDAMLRGIRSQTPEKAALILQRQTQSLVEKVQDVFVTHGEESVSAWEAVEKMNKVQATLMGIYREPARRDQVIAFVMFYFLKFSAKDIGEILGIDPGYIYQFMKYCKCVIKQRF